MKYLPWDILAIDNTIIFVLWDTIAFPELVKQEFRLWSNTIREIAKKICKEQTMTMIHWLVGHRFSSYRKVLPLYFSSYLLHNYQVKKKKKQQNTAYIFDVRNGFSPSEQMLDWQQLILFPDLRSLKQYTVWLQSIPATVSIYWTRTDRQSLSLYQDIQSNTITTLCTTHAHMFQDWNNLSLVQIVDPDKRYFASQQDPRYKVSDVAKYLSNVYNSSYAELQA